MDGSDGVSCAEPIGPNDIGKATHEFIWRAPRPTRVSIVRPSP
jgi:hypothetical protein